MSRRTRALVVSGLAVVLAASGLSAYWAWSAARLEARILEWTAEQRARGYAIDYAGPDIGGFPFELTARFGEPRVRSPRGWRWQGPEISGRASLLAPFTVTIDFAGRHHIVSDERGRAAEATVQRATSVVHLAASGRVDRTTAELGDLRVRDDRARELVVSALSVQVGPLRPAQGEQPQRLDLMALASDVILPELPNNPLGRELRDLSLEATVNGEVPSGELREALASWRDDGGDAELHGLQISWGPLTLDGDGAVTLDERLRPLGAFTARMRGLPDTLDLLTRDGLIEPGQALAVKVALLAVSGERDENGRAVVVLPITLQEGLLFLGPVPLLSISPVL